MKRAGFTMIELIFVIVILGILSAVALPKFIGVSEQAEAGKCKSFIGTLNRTVLPALWSDMVLYNKTQATVFTGANIAAQISAPVECRANTRAATASQDVILGDYATAITAGTMFTVEIGEGDFNVSRLTAASTSEAPILGWGKTN